MRRCVSTGTKRPTTWVTSGHRLGAPPMRAHQQSKPQAKHVVAHLGAEWVAGFRSGDRFNLHGKPSPDGKGASGVLLPHSPR